jgi:hypothetical protein
MTAGRDDLAAWVAGYERLWRTAGTDGLRELFTDDATYSPAPWDEPLRGLEAIATFWDSERDGADEAFQLTSEIVALDAGVGVVRVAVDYASGSRWRDLWVVTLADDGRCRAFEEWPFAPRQRTGHE